MQLFKKLKIFSQFFAVYLKRKWNFGHLEKKDEPHSFCISKIVDSKGGVYLNV